MRSARRGSCPMRRSPSSFRRGILFAFFLASEGSGRTAPTRFGTAAFFATSGCRRRWRKEETSAFVRLSSFLFQSRSESLPLASMGSNPLRERKDFRGRGTSEIAKEARVDRSFESLRATLSFRRGVACENLFPCASNPYLSLALSLLREILASSSEKETRLQERERALHASRWRSRRKPFTPPEGDAQVEVSNGNLFGTVRVGVVETLRWNREEEEASREADRAIDVDACSLLEGDPRAYLPFFRYVMLEYSVPLKRELFHQEEMLEGWEDGKFAEAMFRACRDKLHLFPSLNAKQFMSQGFSERKLILLLDVVAACRIRNTELQRQMRIESRRITAADVRHLHENNRSRFEGRMRTDDEGIRQESERKKSLPMEESLLVRMAKQVSELTTSLEKLSASLSETEQRVESIELAQKQDHQSIQLRVEQLEERMDGARPSTPSLVRREEVGFDEEARASRPEATLRTDDVSASEVRPTGAPFLPSCDSKILSAQGSTRELVEAVRQSCSSARSLLASLH